MSILYEYQKDIVKDVSRLAILKKSRQIGGTFAHAFKATQNAIFKKRNQLVISNSQRQSRIVMAYVSKFVESFKYLKEFRGLKFEIDQSIEKKFPAAFGGASIFSLPPNPETIRGFNGDIFLDEFALYKNDKRVYEAIFPSITRGYDLSISSTCFGMQNLFYDIFSDEIRFKDYVRKSLTIYDAIARGLTGIDIELLKNNFDLDSWRQEFLTEFIDESTSYFPYALLRELFDDFEEVEIKGRCFIGIDVGRSHDRTAVLIIRQVGNLFYLTRKEVLANMKFPQQIQIISQIFYEEQPSRVLVDRGLIGMQLAETLADKYPFVEGVNFVNTFIAEIVTNAKKIFEQKNFKMNEDKDLISEIHSINKNVSESNLVSFKSKRDAKGHSDSAWALLLALYCTKEEEAVGESDSYPESQDMNNYGFDTYLR